MDPENEEEEFQDPSNEPDEVTEDGTDQNGNPIGTEYDDDGEPILEEEPEPEPTAAADPPTAKKAPAAPAFVNQPVMSAEEAEYGEALGLTPQVVAFFAGIMDRRLNTVHQSYAVANAGMDAALAGAPTDYRQMVAPRLSSVFARMTPQQRADPRAADDALAVVMTEEARETGESFMQVVARHLQMRSGTTPAKRPPVAVRPPAARAPAPSNAGRGTVVRGRMGAPTTSKNLELVASTLGITVAEAEQMGLK